MGWSGRQWNKGVDVDMSRMGGAERLRGTAEDGEKKRAREINIRKRILGVRGLILRCKDLVTTHNARLQ